MLSPTRGWLRVVRAASLGVVGFVLALVAHVSAGGAAPGPAALLLLAGLIGLATVLLTGVRLRPVHVAVSLTAMQVILHETFMRLGAPADCLISSVSAPGGVHPGHGGIPGIECATGIAHAGMGQHSVFAATAMVCAHVAATAVMAVLLAYGERVLWFLAGCLRSPRWLTVPLPAPPEVRIVSSRAPRMLRVRYAYGGVGRRGPPSQGQFAIG